MEYILNIFTLNCWGIPIVSKNRKERIEAIAKYLVESSHNIICLQEVWSENDYVFMKNKLKETHPFSHYFYSGVLGSGLCVFSKWLIQDVFFHQWPLNGYIHKIHHGDWFGGKGVGLCRIKVNDLLVNVYCTHLHAEYHEDDIYLAHRALQAYSTGEFVKLTSSSADICVLAGDLNTAPGALSFRLITQIPHLTDPVDSECLGSNPCISKPSGTSDNVNNSYSDPKLVLSAPEGKRIDHILFHKNPYMEVNVINFGNPLEDRVPGQDFSYSDHNGVSLELRLRRSQEKHLDRQQSKNTNVNDTILETIKICEEALESLNNTKRLFLFLGGLLLLFLIGTAGFWPSRVLYDVVKILLTGISLYYLLMGTLWSRIETNSIKAGLSGLQNVLNSES